MPSADSPPAGPSIPAHRRCVICFDPITTNARDGVIACRACRAFFKRHTLRSSQEAACPRNGDCQQVRGGPTACAPCRLSRCLEAGLSVDTGPNSQGCTEADGPLCHLCHQINHHKETLTCSQCNHIFHLSCVNITRAQAAVLSVWHCSTCLRSAHQHDAVQDAVPANETPPVDMAAELATLKARTKVLQHVPRRHRHRVATDLANAIMAALEQGTPLAWWRMFSYMYRSPLAVPADTSPSRERASHNDPRPANEGNADAYSRRVQRKCADGDIRAALRLLTTSDTVIPPSEQTTDALRAKHPPAQPAEEFPEMPDPDQHRLTVTEVDVMAAIKAFSPGSAAGPDGLRPLHLMQLVARYTAEAGQRLLSALTELCNVTIAGELPEHATQAFFGANLTAIKKKDGGIRPIAVGSIYRRLASKMLAKRMSSVLAPDLQPAQLGVGVRNGCEAAVHAVRDYIDTHVGSPGHIIIKLDLTNAFNSIHRSVVLREVVRRFPAAAPLVSQAYSKPSPLHFGPTRLWSCRGVQQGDPLGPILFALALDPAIQSLRSPLNLWFLDDGTLAGPRDTVAADLHRLVPTLLELGLTLNERKCEIAHLDDPGNNTTNTVGHVQVVEDSVINGAARAVPHNVVDSAPHTNDLLSAAHHTPLTSLSILGAPIHVPGNDEALGKIEEITQVLIDRTANIGSHAALFFLSRYAAVPRATYLLRAAPVHAASESLRAIDELMRQATSRCCNIQLEDDPSWTQASLPLRFGGLGVRRLTDVALPAYIASLEASRDLVCTINRRPNGDRLPRLDSALQLYTNTMCPDFNVELGLKQRTLDDAATQRRLDDLLGHANQIDRARLLAATAPHSGSWLSAIPVESLGLLLPDDAVRVNVALRLGLQVQQPHRCRCGVMTDALGHHNLSCNINPGRLPRHAALNDVVYRALAAAGVVATLEPRGLDRGDGRRPDGITIFPFRQGKMLMWDATCVNTFCRTHINDCAVAAGAAARAAEDRKRRRYADLARRYDFAPLAVETSGVVSPAFKDLLQEIGRRIRQRSGEARETAWLRQRVSLAVARGNAAAICGPHSSLRDLP